ncbi:MFS transporter, partial [Sulfolobus sp. E5]
ALILNMIIAGIGLLLVPFSPNIYVLGLLRFIIGLGVGPEALIVLDVMITEFFPSAFRGKALAIGYTASWTAPIVEVAIREKGNLGEPVQVQVITSQKVKISELFSPLYRKRTTMLWIFEFLQAGVYYGFASLAPSVLYAKGFTLVHTLQYSMLIYTSYFLSSLASIFIIDSTKFDRKWQVSIVMLLMGITGLAFGFSITPVEGII